MNAPVKVDAYPLPAGDLAKHGIAARQIDHLDALIKRAHRAGRYPGAQIALARNGELLLFRSYGKTSTDANAQAVNDRTLFQMFSQTKVFTSAAVWTLIEEGKLSFMDKVADHLPEFAARGKADITLHQVMSHTGGFPSGDVSEAAWTDHELMRKEVCDFSLDWTPGTRLQYHPRAAHLVQGMVIEAVTGKDYRDVIRERITEPLGIADDVFVGVPEAAGQPLRDDLRRSRRSARQPPRSARRRPAGRRRLRHRARHHRVLPGAAEQGHAQRPAHRLAAADRLCGEEPDRRDWATRR